MIKKTCKIYFKTHCMDTYLIPSIFFLQTHSFSWFGAKVIDPKESKKIGF